MQDALRKVYWVVENGKWRAVTTGKTRIYALHENGILYYNEKTSYDGVLYPLVGSHLGGCRNLLLHVLPKENRELLLLSATSVWLGMFSQTETYQLEIDLEGDPRIGLGSWYELDCDGSAFKNALLSYSYQNKSPNKTTSPGMSNL